MNNTSIITRKVSNLWDIVLVELTTFCNFHCSFCPSDSMKRVRKHMPRELWQKVLTELSEKKMTKKVFFHLVGEPLLHPDIFEAITFANNKGLSVSLYTNGAMLKSEQATQVLDVLRNGGIVVSLQELDGSSFVKRSGGALSWERYTNQLRDFIIKAASHPNHPQVQIHYLADIQSHSWHIGRTLHLQKLLQRMYDQWRQLLNISNRRRINILNPGLLYPLSDNISFFVKHRGNWDNMHIPPDYTVIPRDKGVCEMMKSMFAVLSNGICTYCCCDYEGELSLGNAENQSLEEIYYSEKATAMRNAEIEGIMIEDRCKICRGSLVYKNNGRPVPSRNLITEMYLFRLHLGQFGLSKTLKKSLENIIRRLGW